MHYANFGANIMKRDKKDPFYVNNQEIEIIGGYAIPGNYFKVIDMSYKGKNCRKGYDSHFARVNYKYDFNGVLQDFYPDLNENELADESIIFLFNSIVVLFNTAQFLPCFLLTLKRVKNNDYDSKNDNKNIN
jgi:hypothetical protein